MSPASPATVMVALLTLTVLAGCLSDDTPEAFVDPLGGILPPSLRENLTEPLYALLGHFEAKWRGTTGTQLYVDYYRPNVPDDVKTPVILVFTPYQIPDPEEVAPGVTEPIVGESFWAYSSYLVDYFVPRGYTVAFADVRGNHQAGGCIDQTGPEQWQDGYDYVEWLGTQDWSNGKVGMFGASYDGETQFTTAMMAPPHLATIVPVASVSNQYEWNFMNGVPYEGQPLSGMSLYFALSAVPSTDPMDAPKWPEKASCQKEQFENGLDFSGDMNTFWKERDYRPMADRINASVLHIHGLQDWNVRPIHIAPLFNDIESTKRGLFGQWAHAYPDRGDWQEILHAWYDHFLMGRENGILDILPPVLIEDDTQQWHGLEAFPPKEQPWLELELSADMRLVPVGEAENGSLAIHDYAQEVLVDIGSSSVNKQDGLARQVPDKLVFSWQSAKDLHLVGIPEVLLTAQTDAVSTHWAVRIEVVGDDCTYVYRASERTPSVCQNSGYFDTRHRDGLDAPRDLTPGEAYELTIPMYPQYDVIPAGATVRLTLSNNDPHISQDTTFADSRVLVGDGRSLLRLPLSPGSIELPHDELPEIYPGYLR
ncbi:MAG: CocE/NonD family hydrolase [Euryarchaeota archaeon]|nr:CocE/NonD family hydrolase [Euryarchaeota archaeon]